MLIYSQKTGRLSDEKGHLIGQGWSGQLGGYNEPLLQSVASIGPLPVGMYTIGEVYTHEHLGPIVMNLEPDKYNTMYGRSLFRIHGASSQHPELSSHGCIIMPRVVRVLISKMNEKRLQVVSGTDILI